MTANDIRNLSEEELLCRAQGGSSACFGALAERHRPGLLALLARRRVPPHDAEDVVQEAFVRAYAALPSYEPARPFGAWLTTIALNVAASEWRRRREAVSDSLEVADAVADPADRIAQRESGANLWTAASALLPRRQYEALYLRYAREMSVGEVAASLGISGIHAKVLLYRARKALLSSSAFRRATERADGYTRNGGIS